jgi:hypothetical protein
MEQVMSSRVLALSLTVALVAVLAGTSCGQLRNLKASIAGTVYMDGRQQAWGTVQAMNEAGQVVAQERCTDSGHYQLKNLDPGRYTLVYVNNMGVPYGGETVVEVRRGRFEQVDLYLSSADRMPMTGR